jgi:hypothetical protein
MIVGADASGEELQGKVCPLFSILLFSCPVFGDETEVRINFGRWNRPREMFRRATHLVLPR